MKYEVWISGGIGDLISHLARLGNLIKDGNQVKFRVKNVFPLVEQAYLKVLEKDPRLSDFERADVI